MNDNPLVPARAADEPAQLGELRSAEAFARHLVDLVEAQMTAHLEAGSVDEWHHRLLDGSISAAVAGEQNAIVRAGGVRRGRLRADLAAVKLEIEEVGNRATEAAAALAPAQARVAQAETPLRLEVSHEWHATADGRGGPARLAQIHEQIIELSSAIDVTLKRTGVPFLGALPDVIRVGEERAASLARQIAQQEERVDQVRNALERLTTPSSEAAGTEKGDGSEPGRSESEAGSLGVAA